MKEDEEPVSEVAIALSGAWRPGDEVVPSSLVPRWSRNSPTRPNLVDTVRVIAVDVVRRYGRPIPRRLLRDSVNAELARLGYPGRITTDVLRDCCRPVLAAEQVQDQRGRPNGMTLDLIENVSRRAAFREAKADLHARES